MGVGPAISSMGSNCGIFPDASTGTRSDRDQYKHPEIITEQTRRASNVDNWEYLNDNSISHVGMNGLLSITSGFSFLVSSRTWEPTHLPSLTVPALEGLRQEGRPPGVQRQPEF